MKSTCPGPENAHLCESLGCRLGGCQGRLPKRIALALALILIPMSVWAQAISPDPKYTPGEFASTDVNDVCSTKGGTYSQRHRLTQTPAVKKRVLANYNVPWSQRARYEDDHDGPLCLGGADTVGTGDSRHGNRWPQPRFGTWNAALKDKLEAFACRQVCHAHPPIPLNVAQGWFKTDWRIAYCKYFLGPPCPVKW